MLQYVAPVSQSLLSHRQQLGDKEPVSHPEEAHDPTEGVRRGLTAVGPFLGISLATILHRPANGGKGQMWSQGWGGGR